MSAIGYWLGAPWLALPVVGLQRAVARFKGGDARRDAEALGTVIGLGADLYCTVIWLLRGFHFAARPPAPVSRYPTAPQDPEIIPAEPLDVGEGVTFQYGKNDYDAPERRMTLKNRLVYLLLRHAPEPRPDHRELPPIEEYQRLLRDVFRETFTAYRKGPVDDVDAAAVPVRYLTHDMPATCLRKQADGRYVCDLSHQESLPLKHGDAVFEPYGGKLVFDRALRDVSIEYRGQVHRPGDEGWPLARYVFMTSALLTTVIEQHTVYCHLLNSALFALKSRLLLPPGHPMYRLMRPFTLKSVAVNEHAKFTIVEQSGAVYHGTAYAYESLKGLYRRAFHAYRHTPLPRLYHEQGFTTEPEDGSDDFPFLHETTRVYAIIDRFVARYLALYWPTEASLAADADLGRWYREVVDGLPPTSGQPRELTLASLKDLVAVFVYTVTFYHDVTSQTGNSLYDYRLGAVLVRRGARYGTFHPSMQQHLVTLLVHQLTTIQSVKVIDDFHKFWLDDRARDVAVRFQDELREYRVGLHERDATRQVSYRCTDPELTETSVQT